jgi:hypothetical protein
MTINYIKIWVYTVKKYLSLQVIVKMLIECLVYLSVFYVLTRNIKISLMYLIFLVAIKSSIQLFIFYKKLYKSDNYKLVLIRPIHPLFGLLVYSHNLLDITILLPVLIYLKIEKYFLNKKK